MQNEITLTTGLGRTLLTNKLAKVGELVGVFIPAFAVIVFVGGMVGENPLLRGGVILAANLLMIATVWLGLRLRGQGWTHFGLSFRLGSRRTVVRTVLLSFAVFVAAVLAVVVGAIVMANIVGRPEGADMSGYTYLRGNLPVLIVSLGVVYISSSFSEEVIYRAFLMTRIAELGSGSKGAWRLAVVVSAIVFGMIHSAWALTGMVQMGFMGLALGVSYLVVRRNLWVMILAHVYLDTVLLVPLYLGAG